MSRSGLQVSQEMSNQRNAKYASSKGSTFSSIKMRRRILRFFSKIDNSQQMDPLINNAIKRQHLIIPGPSSFHQRTAKNIRRAQLLEHYDADSFFSDQAIKRLRRMRKDLPKEAFLKLMEVMVAIFDVYLASKEKKYGQSVGRFVRPKEADENLDENNIFKNRTPITKHVRFSENTASQVLDDVFPQKLKGLKLLNLKPFSELEQTTRCGFVSKGNNSAAILDEGSNSCQEFVRKGRTGGAKLKKKCDKILKGNSYSTVLKLQNGSDMTKPVRDTSHGKGLKMCDRSQKGNNSLAYTEKGGNSNGRLEKDNSVVKGLKRSCDSILVKDSHKRQRLAEISGSEVVCARFLPWSRCDK